VELCESGALELLFQSWSSAKHALKVVVLQIVVIARVPIKVGAPTQSNKGFKWRVSLVLVLDYLQQVVVAHLQEGSICSRREENPVLQKRRVSSSVPSSLRATTRQLCSHGRWDRACYGRRRRSEAKMETRQTHRIQARRGEREVAPTGSLSPSTESSPEEPKAEEASASTSARAVLSAAEAEELLAFLESVRTSMPDSVFEQWRADHGGGRRGRRQRPPTPALSGHHRP
jgi:hypothetical protein